VRPLGSAHGTVPWQEVRKLLFHFY
jgi:hypothetical protein